MLAADSQMGKLITELCGQVVRRLEQVADITKGGHPNPKEKHTFQILQPAIGSGTAASAKGAKSAKSDGDDSVAALSTSLICEPSSQYVRHRMRHAILNLSIGKDQALHFMYVWNESK